MDAIAREHVEERERALEMLRYFHNEKGDMRRWTYFAEAIELFPEVKRALSDYEHAAYVLKLVLEDAQ